MGVWQGGARAKTCAGVLEVSMVTGVNSVGLRAGRTQGTKGQGHITLVRLTSNKVNWVRGQV